MSIPRRSFLTGISLAGAAAITTTSVHAGESILEGVTLKSDKPAKLNLSSQLGIIPGKDLDEKLAKMEKWGFDGVELGGDVVGNEKKFLDAVAKTKLKISAICWGAHDGDIVSDEVEKRQPAIDDLKRVLESAGEIKSTGVIYVPAFNGQTKLTNQEIRKILLDVMPAIGEHAVKCGSRILFEPLNRNEAYFLRQLADAASICRDCKSDGICMMGDFYHMNIEETSDLGAFISAGKYLHHVHLASRKRNLPGQDERSFIDGFKGLKFIGFQDFCSLECGVEGDRDKELPKSVRFLREQWEKA
jgi:sugar phosphate isomerase/epimerase